MVLRSACPAGLREGDETPLGIAGRPAPQYERSEYFAGFLSGHHKIFIILAKISVNINILANIK